MHEGPPSLRQAALGDLAVVLTLGPEVGHQLIAIDKGHIARLYLSRASSSSSLPLTTPSTRCSPPSREKCNTGEGRRARSDWGGHRRSQAAGISAGRISTSLCEQLDAAMYFPCGHKYKSNIGRTSKYIF